MTQCRIIFNYMSETKHVSLIFYRQLKIEFSTTSEAVWKRYKIWSNSQTTDNRKLCCKIKVFFNLFETANVYSTSASSTLFPTARLQSRQNSADGSLKWYNSRCSTQNSLMHLLFKLMACGNKSVPTRFFLRKNTHTIAMKITP